VTAPAPPSRGLDPEAEQEVDFAKYVRLLAVRWWLLAAGLVAGAVIGYLVSLGGSQVYSATATIYLGQPYTPTGGAVVQDQQTNPSAVGAIINSQSVDNTVANRCSHAKASEFKNGISSQATATGSGSSSKTGAAINPLVKISVQAKKGKLASCAANALAEAAVKGIGAYPAHQIANLKAQIAFDNEDIKTIQVAIANPSISATDKLVLQTTLRSDQLDKTTNSGLLLLATQVERPQLLAHAASHKITARSRRNTVVIAALIGLILGALAALLWDSVVPRLAPRNGE
jgi:capsular polysaccharide biosynthesis protein